MVFSQLYRVVDCRQAEAASRLCLCQVTLNARLDWQEAHGILPNLERNGLTQGTADDGNHRIVVAGKMVEQHGVCRPAVVVRKAGSLQGDGLDEILLLPQRNQGAALLNQAFDPLPVGPDVTDELAELARLQNQLPESLVAQGSVLLAIAVVRVQADEHQIIDSSRNVGGTEIPGIVS